MLLFCKKINVEVSIYLVLTPTFIIEPNIMGILERELGRNERYDVKIFVETDYL